MKFNFVIIISLTISVVFSACNNSSKPVDINSETEAKGAGTAVLITDAAARIPQEAALLERLYHTGELKKVVFIGGASSGALNAVMLNGILSNKITWKQYEHWLSEITNDSI